MIRNLKCRDCKPPKRFPGCHASCQEYLSWKEEYDKQKEQERKTKWLNNLGRK